MKLNRLLFEQLLITRGRLKVKRDDPKIKKYKKHLQKEIDLSNRRRKNWMMALYNEFDDSEDFSMN
ncbi:hypothetical protein QE450_004175 [Paenibacillus sp. SORGH_AS306]|uniref:hypothetical protein n=1 Tax=unclassified Paenibacillus TaxID=185978 RepID=UPI002780520D|nr:MULTISPECIES: hypothetical protein [unclassified Paenibacillus]MDQ1236677.1 hypothetical protein [Paenibacillus sp. SORGH_AS_0306]MDR6109034.1 hypothetical protein [Paenibacillus sp. SORGH_AS_0338]